MSNFFKDFLDTVQQTLTLSGRARVMSQLRQMDKEFLTEYGFDPDKLNDGLSAWPWGADAPREQAPAKATVTELPGKLADATDPTLPKAA